MSKDTAVKLAGRESIFIRWQSDEKAVRIPNFAHWMLKHQHHALLSRFSLLATTQERETVFIICISQTQKKLPFGSIF